MREQVVTRTGKAGATAKNRAGVTVQRPTPRRARPAAPKEARQKSFAWKSALAYLPAALKVLLAVSLGVLAFVGYRTAVSASFFKVRTIDVQGATHTSREDIRAAVQRLSNAGVWQSDLSAITGELKSLPWVRDAVVSRVLPDGLRVRVTEREPRVIARNSKGRLVWADEEGVMLGAAVPGDEDFLFRGLDENDTEQARRDNRARMALALGLKADWESAGLSKRISEVDLTDLRDVRVHLAGADSGIQVSLVAQQEDSKRSQDDSERLRDYSKRFRDALKALSQQEQANEGLCFSYIVMIPGRSPVFGTRPCNALTAGHGETTHTDESAATSNSASPSVAAPNGAAASTRAEKKAARQSSKPVEKKENATRAHDAALRPRRVN